MKPKHTLIILMILAIILTLAVSNYSKDEKTAVIEQKEPQIENLDTIQIPTDWNLFIEALIFVESRGNENAVGNGDCVGVLQITPIYVRECNRLIGYEKYDIMDRFDSLKSIELFTIIQSHYNPEKDIEKAIYLHNKNAPKEYKNKIINKFNEIKKNKE